MRQGAQIVVAPHMDAAAVHQMFSVPEAFVSMCKIVREDETDHAVGVTQVSDRKGELGGAAGERRSIEGIAEAEEIDPQVVGRR